MDRETLRLRGERLSEELGREAYRAGAGLLDETRFEEIYSRYSDLTNAAALESARPLPALFEYSVDLVVGRAVAPLDDRLHSWETGAVVAVNGQSLPYQRLWVDIANEPDRERRLALDRARRAMASEPAALRRERLVTERALLDDLLRKDYVAARSELSGIDLDALAGQCDAFLRETTDLYREALEQRLRSELAIRPGEAERSDSAFLFRGARFDDVFGAEALVPLARRQVGEMGLDAEAAGRIRYDTGERPRKRARAFCAAVRVPDEVYLVIRPHGGYVDYRAFWHELGHALHFSNADRDLPFEARWGGDNSVTEAYAMLFEYMLQSGPWLTRYAGLAGERLGRFRRDQAFALLAIVRRYCAKLRYELSLHRAASLEQGSPAYAEMLTEATGFRYADEDALLDLDDGFYSARYLRAWQLEAMLRAHFTERFDEDWCRNPRSGPALLELLSLGQRDDAARLAADRLGGTLSFTAIARTAEAALG